MEFYTGILQTSKDYRKQWQYSRGNGWILKVDDMRKALYYLIAFDEGIEISLTVRDNERAAFLGNILFQRLHAQLERGTKYPEGYALRFEIESAAECASVAQFLAELMRMRSAKSRSAADRPGKKARPRRVDRCTFRAGSTATRPFNLRHSCGTRTVN